MTSGSAAVKFKWAWAALLVAKIVLAWRLPLFGDEAFYWQEGQHLAWAYSDLPGLTAWLARVGVDVAGTHPLGLRWPFLFIGAIVPWIAVRIARREWGGEAGWHAGLFALALPLSGWLGTLALPDAPLVLACLLALDATCALLRRVSAGALVELAVALCAGALTHYRFAPAVLAGFVGLLLLPRGRALLREPVLYVPLALGVLAWAPVLLWNQAHHGAGVEFQLLERHPWKLHGGGESWPLVQALAVTPGLFLLALGTGRWLWRAWRGDRDDVAGVFLGVALVSVLGYFVLAFFADTERVSFHWPLAGWLGMLCAAPGVFAGWSRGARRATWALALAGHAVVLVALLAFSLPDGRARLADSSVYPDNFAGWSEVAAAVHRSGARGTRVVADNFMLGAQLGFARDDASLPVLDHPLNHKHGRAAQLQQWGLQRQGRADLGAGPLLLVVEDTARPLKERLAGYRDLCERLGPLPPPRVVNVDHGRKRFLLYRIAAWGAGGRCELPALAWIDTPVAGAVVAGTLRVEGWAFRDGGGLRGVEVMLDGVVRARADYGRPMPNVAAYWGGSTDPNQPRVGFAAELDLRDVAAGTHWLGLRLHGSDGRVEDWAEQRLVVRQGARGATFARVTGRAMRALRQGEAGLAQRLGQVDQRQADERGRVAGVDGFEQADAQAFALEAAGAIVGLLGVEVALDLGRVQAPEHDFGAIAEMEGAAGVLAQQAGGRMEHHAAARGGGQLVGGPFEAARLAQDLAVDLGDLVRADHPGLRRAPGDGLALGRGEALRERGRRLADVRGLVDIGARHVEGDAQALQQLAPVSRG
jgi:4-amino-4-deoxy-L-arabinose transferase-like glycosyltransferase